MLISELEANPSMGDTRIYKFVKSILITDQATQNFLINEGYQSWLVRKTAWMISYRKTRYEITGN